MAIGMIILVCCYGTVAAAPRTAFVFGGHHQCRSVAPLFAKRSQNDDVPSSSFLEHQKSLLHEAQTNNDPFGELYSDTTTFYDIPNSDEETVSDSLLWTDRDEDEILTEREDRFYMDEFGIRRKIETCVLVGVEEVKEQRTSAVFSLTESMSEMRELIKTAGMELVGEMTQRLQQVNPKTYIGSGKVQEVKSLLEERDCYTIVFDAELTPGQQKALENSFNRHLKESGLLKDDYYNDNDENNTRGIKVIDRTALILDIFAQHAKTREGKLQVDLALHEYRKPRLTKLWTHLERQSGAGGVGLRGPGESQLELDKRMLRDRVIVLKQKIDAVQKQRAMHRRNRHRLGLPLLSLVGYTNAGKSTLLNQLTRAGVMAEEMLFATLDPTTRKVQLPGQHKTHPEVLLTDTVGFIQKLPTQLVAAFRATLEEVQHADVLIHVIDVSNPTWKKQERAVQTVLREMGVADKPMVRVLNKIDSVPQLDAEYLKFQLAKEAAANDQHHQYSVVVSAMTGEGMEEFVAVVEEALTDLLVPIEVEIPYSKGQDLNAVHERGNVETMEYRSNGTYIVARVPLPIANRLQQYNVKQTWEDQQSLQESTHFEEKEDEDIDWVALGRGRHSETK